MKNRKNTFVLLVIILTIIFLPLLLISLKNTLDNRSHAAPPEALETESGVLTGNASKQNDSSASGGSYVVLGINQIQNSAIGPQPVASTPLSSGTKFVSSTGSGTACTQASPCTLSQAVTSAAAGDVVFMRGGTYPITTILQWNNNGTASNYITFESYPGESAILDGSNQPNNSQRMLRVGGNYYKFRKFEIRNMPDIGFYITGSNNVLDGLNVNHNRNSGIYVIGGNNNIIQNTYANDNSDAGLTGGNYDNGGNADGIGISSGDSNKVLNSISARNSDDGTDAWTSTNTIISNSIATTNGLGNGDGNGFKLGGPSPSNGTHIDHSISYSNKVTGFDANSGPNVVINFVTSWNNGAYGIFPVASTAVTNSISINNTSGNIYANGIQTNNSWQRSGTPAFISTDPNSANFLKPTVGGGFEDIGAYAGKVNQTPTPTSGNVTYDAVFTGDATGATDVSSALQTFLTTHNNQHIALAVNGIYKVSAVKMTGATGVTLDFRGSKIIGTVVGNQFISILGSTNITFNDPWVVGTGYSYTDPTQWEHGISIAGGSNITINHPIMSDLKGDGVAVSDESGPYSGSAPTKIVINNPDITRTGRNGISVIAGEATINGGKISHSGLGNIDFEPNRTDEAVTLKGIVNGVDMRTYGDLQATAYAWTGGESFAVAAGGSTGTKQYINVINCTGDRLRMGIYNTASSTITGNVSDTAKPVYFVNVGSVTFANNTNLTRQ